MSDYLTSAIPVGLMDAPGNKLHRLEGDLAHHWAVSVSGKWATHILIRWGRRDFCRLPRLPLEVKNMSDEDRRPVLTLSPLSEQNRL
jgi:hypothetical protein